MAAPKQTEEGEAALWRRCQGPVHPLLADGPRGAQMRTHDSMKMT